MQALTELTWNTSCHINAFRERLVGPATVLREIKKSASSERRSKAGKRITEVTIQLDNSNIALVGMSRTTLRIIRETGRSDRPSRLLVEMRPCCVATGDNRTSLSIRNIAK